MAELWTKMKPELWAKSYEIPGPLPLEIDYDDVHHDGTELLAHHVVDTLNSNWVTLYVWECDNEDEDKPDECYNSMRPIDEPQACPHCGQLCTVSEAFAS